MEDQEPIKTEDVAFETVVAHEYRKWLCSHCTINGVRLSMEAISTAVVIATLVIVAFYLF